MTTTSDPSNTSYVDEMIEDVEELTNQVDEEESGLSDKPWKQTKKRKSVPRRRYTDDDWEEQNRARQKYLKEWEEDLRYAKELADEGM